ncbi:hypothetical protein [Streptomyces pseudovenezuelae]|uniref:PPM-type phosphatase domain-containing protein n=1 Tax=Streptomyces pseudovenezuelae TaxID=67350 RepID=A0ABZ1WMC3_9ACTN|nr:hypothetical protein [Streptomyces pseudovenezuelae]
MLVFCTDGLVETPGVDLDGSFSCLANHFAKADERDLDLLLYDAFGAAEPVGGRGPSVPCPRRP